MSYDPTIKPLLSQCAWCKKWINQRGEVIKLPAWVDVDAHNISHGICMSCLSEQFGEIPQVTRIINAS